MFSRRTILVVLLILSASLLSCRKAYVRDIPENTIPTTYDKSLTVEEIEAAIIMGGNEAGWNMRKQEPGLIVGVIQVRQHEAEVGIRYTATTWSITYRNSSNLKYNGEKIHVNYNKWVSRLADAIRKQFGEALGIRGKNKK